MNNNDVHAHEEAAPHRNPAFARIKQVGKSRVARTLSLVGVVAIIALVFTGQQDQSGAATPTEVVEKVVTALEQGDILGVIDVMDPGEREIVKEIFLSGSKELSRLGVIKESSEQKSSLFRYQIENLRVREQCVSDDICNVYLSGNIIGSLNGQTEVGEVFKNSSAFENVDTLQDLIFELTSNSDSFINESFEDLRFTTVQSEERWYASIGFTVAELLRNESTFLDTNVGMTPAGKDSPEEVVESFLRSIEIFDVRGVLQELDPREFSPAQRYAGLIVNSVKQDIERLTSDDEFQWDITDLKTEVVDQGSSTAQVRITELTMLIKIWDSWDEYFSQTEIEIFHTGEDINLTIRNDGQTNRYRLQDFIVDEINKSIVKDSYDTFIKTFLSITTHRRDGKWFVSPVASVSGILIDIFKYLDRDDLRRLLDRVE